MARVSPLRKEHQHAEASFLPYGAPIGGEGAADPSAIEVVETFGEIEAEYAAVRKGCILLDLPHRAVLAVRGADRRDFLNRMVTQELRGLGAWTSADAFWLNRKGRIDADLRIVEMGEDHLGDAPMLIDVDVHAASHAAQSLGAFIFSEDASFACAGERLHRLALHGPRSQALLTAVSEHIAGPAPGDLTPDRACVVRIVGREVVVDRRDTTGEVGLELFVRTEDVEAVWRQIVETGLEHEGMNGANGGGNGQRHRLRPAGWAAYNIARIEAGTALFNIDFGPASLPHETGILERRVSFTKGCYLGQEVVARMQSLGKPKQRLVGLRVESIPSETGDALQPLGGGQVFLVQGEGAERSMEVVGAITSSALSPMLGGAPVCFAQVRARWTQPGTTLQVIAEGRQASAVVQDGLCFWSRA